MPSIVLLFMRGNDEGWVEVARVQECDRGKKFSRSAKKSLPPAESVLGKPIRTDFYDDAVSPLFMSEKEATKKVLQVREMTRSTM